MIRVLYIAFFALIIACVPSMARADAIPTCTEASITFVNHRTGTARVCVGEPAELWSIASGYFMRSFSQAGCFVHPPPGTLVDVNDQIRVGHDYAFVFGPDRPACRTRPLFISYLPIIGSNR